MGYIKNYDVTPNIGLRKSRDNARDFERALRYNWDLIDGAISGGVNLANLGSVSVESPQWVPGRVWGTSFSSALRDATRFDVTNLTYGTEDAAPCVRATTPAALSTFLTKEQLGNCRVRIRYKVAADGVNPITSSAIWCFAKHWHYSADTVYALDQWAAGGLLWARSLTDGNDGFVIPNVAKATFGLDNASNAVWRYLELEVVENIVKVRNWVEGTEQPDWQMIRESRTFNWTENEPPTGPAGFGFITTGAAVSEVVVTELVKADSNLLRNAVGREIEYGTGLPVLWNPNRALVAGDQLTISNQVDWNGRTRPVFRIVSTGGGTPGLCWTQSFFAKHGRLFGVTRNTIYPLGPIGPEMEMVVRTKGTGVTNPSPSVLYGGLGLAAMGVIKYYGADDGVELGQFNSGISEGHYKYFGPNVGGTGSWDWYETRHRMSIFEHYRVGMITWTMGLHDTGCAGTLLIADPFLRPVG